MHSTLRILFFTILACSFAANTNAVCSLEKMKEFAMNACNHLFMQDEGGRERRSLPAPYEQNAIHHNEYSKAKEKSHYIGRSTFPRGGYLKVNQEHFRILSQVDVKPRYKPKKLHHHDNKTRFKRDHQFSYNNIQYCCFNKCEEDFFCPF